MSVPKTARDFEETAREILRHLAKHAGMDIPSTEYKKLLKPEVIRTLSSYLQQVSSEGYDECIKDLI